MDGWRATRMLGGIGGLCRRDEFRAATCEVCERFNAGMQLGVSRVANALIPPGRLSGERDCCARDSLVRMTMAKTRSCKFLARFTLVFKL
jgi:hypothetical protein